MQSHKYLIIAKSIVAFLPIYIHIDWLYKPLYDSTDSLAFITQCTVCFTGLIKFN